MLEQKAKVGLSDCIAGVRNIIDLAAGEGGSKGRGQ
jgi:hypothetical protein